MRAVLKAELDSRHREIKDAIKGLTSGAPHQSDNSQNDNVLRDDQGRRVVHAENNTRHTWCCREDGAFRRVPPHWVFPKCNLMLACQLWHAGDENNNISPLKRFDTKDMKHVQRGNRSLHELSKTMNVIDKRATDVGLLPNPMGDATREQASVACFQCNSVLGINKTTPTGRKKHLSRHSWVAIRRFLDEQKQEQRDNEHNWRNNTNNNND